MDVYNNSYWILWDSLAPVIFVILQLNQNVSFNDWLQSLDTCLIFGWNQYFSADGTCKLHVYPFFKTLAVENVLLVASQLNNLIARDIILFSPYIEIDDANGALGAIFLMIVVELDYILFDFHPELIAKW